MERGEIGDFGFAEDVNPVGAHKARRVAGEHQAGTGRFGRTNLALESLFRGEQLELQRIPLVGEQVADFEHLTSEPWTGGSYGVCVASLFRRGAGAATVGVCVYAAAVFWTTLR